MNKVSRIFFISVAIVLLTSCSTVVDKRAFKSNAKTPYRVPASIDEPFLTTDDGEKLHCYVLRHKSSDELLIYFHGNGKNINYRIPDLQMLHRLGINVLAISYRGFGKSSGEATESGLYKDGRAALAYAEKELGFPIEKTVFMGRSLGTVVALESARKKACKGVILVSPFTSAKEAAQWKGHGGLAWLAGGALNNKTKIKDLKAPLLIIHGEKDKTVPLFMSETLMGLAKEPKQLVVISGAGHGDISKKYLSPYRQAVKTFLTDQRKISP